MRPTTKLMNLMRSKSRVQKDEVEIAEEGETEEVDENMEEVVATGSRLPEGDTTANMIVYTSEDIAATGASTIE